MDCFATLAMTEKRGFFNKILRIAVLLVVLFKDFRVELDLGSAVALKILKITAMITQS